MTTLKAQTVLHTKIKIKPLAKNGSKKFGFNAECRFHYEGSEQWIDFSAHSETEYGAELKVRRFMSANGFNYLKQIEEE